MTWWEYVERVAQTTRQRDIAERVKIDATNVTRWKNGQVPKADMVAAFARAYNRPVLEAFVAAAFITPKEARERPAAAPSLDTLSDAELLAEVARRLDTTRHASFDPHVTDAGTEPVDLAERRTPIPPSRDDAAQPHQQAARKGQTPPDDWEPR